MDEIVCGSNRGDLTTTVAPDALEVSHQATSDSLLRRWDQRPPPPPSPSTESSDEDEDEDEDGDEDGEENSSRDSSPPTPPRHGVAVISKDADGLDDNEALPLPSTNRQPVSFPVPALSEPQPPVVALPREDPATARASSHPPLLLPPPRTQPSTSTKTPCTSSPSRKRGRPWRSDSASPVAVAGPPPPKPSPPSQPPQPPTRQTSLPSRERSRAKKTPLASGAAFAGSAQPSRTQHTSAAKNKRRCPNTTPPDIHGDAVGGVGASGGNALGSSTPPSGRARASGNKASSVALHGLRTATPLLGPLDLTAEGGGAAPGTAATIAAADTGGSGGRGTPFANHAVSSGERRSDGRSSSPARSTRSGRGRTTGALPTRRSNRRSVAVSLSSGAPGEASTPSVTAPSLPAGTTEESTLSTSPSCAAGPPANVAALTPETPLAVAITSSASMDPPPRPSEQQEISPAPREQALAQGENGTDSGTVGGERQTRTQTTDVIEMRPSSTGNGGGGLGSGGGGGRGAGDGGGDDGAMGKDGPDTTREKGVAMPTDGVLAQRRRTESDSIANRRPKRGQGKEAMGQQAQKRALSTTSLQPKGRAHPTTSSQPERRAHPTRPSQSTERAVEQSRITASPKVGSTPQPQAQGPRSTPTAGSVDERNRNSLGDRGGSGTGGGGPSGASEGGPSTTREDDLALVLELHQEHEGLLAVRKKLRGEVIALQEEEDELRRSLGLSVAHPEPPPPPPPLLQIRPKRKSISTTQKRTTPARRRVLPTPPPALKVPQPVAARLPSSPTRQSRPSETSSDVVAGSLPASALSDKALGSPLLSVPGSPNSSVDGCAAQLDASSDDYMSDLAKLLMGDTEDIGVRNNAAGEGLRGRKVQSGARRGGAFGGQGSARGRSAKRTNYANLDPSAAVKRHNAGRGGAFRGRFGTRGGRGVLTNGRGRGPGPGGSRGTGQRGGRQNAPGRGMRFMGENVAGGTGTMLSPSADNFGGKRSADPKNARK